MSTVGLIWFHIVSWCGISPLEVWSKRRKYCLLELAHSSPASPHSMGLSTLFYNGLITFIEAWIQPNLIRSFSFLIFPFSQVQTLRMWSILIFKPPRGFFFYMATKRNLFMYFSKNQIRGKKKFQISFWKK